MVLSVAKEIELATRAVSIECNASQQGGSCNGRSAKDAAMDDCERSCNGISFWVCCNVRSAFKNFS